MSFSYERTFYIDPTNGDDANPGTGGTAFAFKHLEHWDTGTTHGGSDSDDIVWLSGGADNPYYESFSLSYPGTQKNPSDGGTILEGFQNVTGDGGYAYFDGQSTDANAFTLPSALMYTVFRNLIFENYTSLAINGANADSMRFTNCKFINNGNMGVRVDNDCMFVDCVSSGNGQTGFYLDVAGGVINCVANLNISDGIFINQGSHIILGNLIYDIDALDAGFQGSSNSEGVIMFNTFLDTLTAGTEPNGVIAMGSALDGPLVIANNIIGSFDESRIDSTYGLFAHSFFQDYHRHFIRRNLMFAPNGTDGKIWRSGTQYDVDYSQSPTTRYGQYDIGVTGDSVANNLVISGSATGNVFTDFAGYDFSLLDSATNPARQNAIAFGAGANPAWPGNTSGGSVGIRGEIGAYQMPDEQTGGTGGGRTIIIG